ncbi:MAG TPA: 2-oxo-4-hydroxy-4-carboxy-5-ureidoimidazoline decarboxylase [Candidatus Limnocylindrales bacterium]
MTPGPIEALNGKPAADCVEALAPLFEGAPGFLARLCGARPFGDWAAVFEAARSVARSMPEAEQIALVDAHPRLGAAPGTVSALSYVEQGYDREAAGASAENDGDRVGSELDRLNRAYEARFGFRYCTFVAGRPRAALLPEFERALTSGRSAELARALDAVVDIAEDRWRRAVRAESSEPAARDGAHPERAGLPPAR